RSAASSSTRKSPSAARSRACAASRPPCSPIASTPARRSPSSPTTMGSRRKRAKTPSPSSEPPPEPVFFVDRDLGRRFPERLAALGLRVEVHDDHYPGENKPPDH